MGMRRLAMRQGNKTLPYGAVATVTGMFVALSLFLSSCSLPRQSNDETSGDDGTDIIMSKTENDEKPDVEAGTAEDTKEGRTVMPADGTYLERARFVVDKMTVAQRAAITIMPNADGGAFFAGLTSATDEELQSLSQQGWFGLLLSTPNIESPEQLRTLTTSLHEAGLRSVTGTPMLLAVDEEGGFVRRISGKDGMGIEAEPSVSDMGSANDAATAFESGQRIGTYLSDLGFDIDFAPVVDVRTPSCDEVMSSRCISDDPNVVADLAIPQTRGLMESGVAGCLKHYPGLGPTYGDSHEESVTSEKTLTDLLASDLIPYVRANEEGVMPMLMVGHVLTPNLTDDGLPASLSSSAISTIRNEVGYDGLVITDSLGMQAALNAYPQDELAWRAIAAGADVALMPVDPFAAQDAMVSAVERGDLDEGRLTDAATKAVAMQIALSEDDANPWD